MTGTDVSALAFRSHQDSITTVELYLNVVSPDYNFADGARFTFPESVNILDAYVASESIDSVAILFSENEVLFGEPSDGNYDGDGIFANDNDLRGEHL